MDSNQVEDPTYEPLIYRLPSIPHYYGDAVRVLFMIAAVLMLVGAPFYAYNLQTDLPFIVGGTVALVCFAALTTPWKQWVVLLDAVISGVGFIVFELWALNEFNDSTQVATLLRQALAIIYMFSFYYSMKTFRAMLLHQVGENVGHQYHIPEEEDSGGQQHDEAEEQRRADEQEKEQRRMDELLD